jgi:hypothetical protein
LLGRLLRSTALRRFEERDRIQAQLFETGWVDLDAVWGEVFDAAMRRYFRRGIAARDVTAFVRDVRTNVSPELFPQAEAEALIRERLGENVDVTGIDSDAVSSIRVLAFVAVHDALRMSERDLNELIRAAEDTAFADGYSPTLAEP